MIFELSVILLTVAFLLILFKLDKHILKSYGLTVIGVFLFEYFTQALWLNVGLEPWAYLYLDVSWIITLGWATIITVSRKLISLYYDKLQFVYSIVAASIIGFFAEWVVLALGIRLYSDAVLHTLSGVSIGPVPIEASYYIPVFMILVVSFSMYWEDQLKRSPK